MIPEIVKDGIITIESIFVFSDGYIRISAFLRECQAQNCTVHFRNENFTINPGDLSDASVRVKLTAYSMLISYPKAARDYCNYLFSITDKK